MGTGLPPAPRWAWIVMALGVVAIGVLSYFSVNRPPPPSFTPPVDAAAAVEDPDQDQDPAVDPARVLVVGDDLTVDPAAGAASWPQLVVADFSDDERSFTVDVAAADGAGYQRPAPDGATFVQFAADAGGDYDLVVFFGSRNDNAAAPDVQGAATEAFAVTQAASPDAELLVIGPASQIAPPPGYLLTNRDATSAAADEAGATFVDPLAGAWFTGAAARFIGPDGIHPTAEGHRYLADLIGPLIDTALPAPS